MPIIYDYMCDNGIDQRMKPHSTRTLVEDDCWSKTVPPEYLVWPNL